MDLWIWIIGIAVVAFSLASGWFLGRYHSREAKEFETLKVQSELANQDFSKYRAEVSDHFRQTSDLVAAMTASYGAVYEHLTTGAQKLCPNEVALLELEKPVENLNNKADELGEMEINTNVPVTGNADVSNVQKERIHDEAKAKEEKVAPTGTDQNDRIYH